MTKVQTTAQITYRRQTITSEIWSVNGSHREVFTVNGESAVNGHFNTIADAKRSIRMR